MTQTETLLLVLLGGFIGILAPYAFLLGWWLWDVAKGRWTK